ncbi:MAG: hypothetical protein ACRDFQ_07245 [Anaerolineales bacterium]
MDLPFPQLEFKSPWMNAAGCLGFAPDPQGPALEDFGAFVTNPISHRPRRAASGTRMIQFPGGVLLHTGRPNPGFSKGIKQYVNAWERSDLPIVVHLLANDEDELRKSVLRLEEIENIMAIEIGFPPEIQEGELINMIRAASGELPLIAQLPLPRAADLGSAAIQAGAAAVSLGPPRGTLADKKGELVNGRLYGPALFPQAMAAIQELATVKVPVIGAGGVENKAQGEMIMAAGALAVQIDIGLWKT